METSTREFGIQYPMGQDNGFQTWRAWNNRAWPAFYLVDRDGRIVLIREGEGHAREMEGAIRGLLDLGQGAAHPDDDPNLSLIATPEMYFGSKQPTPQDRAQGLRRDEAVYAFAELPSPRFNSYQLDGIWFRKDEALVLRSPTGGCASASSRRNCTWWLRQPRRRRCASVLMEPTRSRCGSNVQRYIRCWMAMIMGSI